MSRPEVSVIIPVYNAEKYIGRCLDSVLGQSYQDFEILVINDGSTDGSDEILKEYERKYSSKMRYIKQKNMGVAKTRNKAVGMAKGEYVAFIDNDDYIDKDYLEKLLPRSGEDVVISGYRRPDENGKIVQKMKLKNVVWSKFTNPTPWAKVYRRDFIYENKIKFLDNDIGEDIYFNLVAMLFAKKVKIIDYVGYNWYYNRKSISSTKHKNFEEVDVFMLLDSCYDELKSRGLLEKNYELIEFFFCRFVVWFLLYSCKGQNKKKITKIYGKLFKWLGERFPEYANNRFLKGKLPGEVKSTRLAYKTFMFFHRLGLGEIVVWLYAKV